MFAGVKEGARMGGKMGVWVGGYFWLEAAIDQSRKGRKDFLSSVVAGGCVAGVWSLWRECCFFICAGCCFCGDGIRG